VRYPPVRFRYIEAASIRRVFPFLPSLIEGVVDGVTLQKDEEGAEEDMNKA